MNVGTLIVSITSGLWLASVVLALTLVPGLALWWLFTGRRPSPAELLGPCFLLGCIVLTALSALIIGTLPSQPAVAWGALGVAALIALGSLAPHRAAVRESLAGLFQSVVSGIRSQPVWWLAILGLASLEFLVCLAPNTAWDAYTLHYGIIEKFWRTGSLAPEGLAPREYMHLNSEVLCSLWMLAAGERAANLMSLLQVFSLGATVYLGISRYTESFWARLGAMVVLGLPVSVHQSSGGWVDTLLVQSVLLGYLCYEAAPREERPLGWAVFAGLCGGYAWGVKQSVPVLLVPLAAIAAFDLLRARDRRLPALVMGAVLVLAAAPWLYRTWTATGNPLYPAFPSLNRLTHRWDLAHAVGYRTPLPWGFVQMFQVHSGAPPKWLDDGVPPWVMLYLLLGFLVLLRTRDWTAAPGRLWAGAILALGPTYYFFFGNSRYAVFAYIIGVVAASITCGRAFGKAAGFRWACAGVGVLCILLGSAIAAGRVWNRREVLTGRVTPLAYVAGTYPHLELLERVRGEIRPGQKVVMFDGLIYRNGMPTVDADPRFPGARVVNWQTESAERVLANCRELGVRWIVVPYGYARFSTGVGFWASRKTGAGSEDQERLKAAVRETFPEWVWKEGAPLWVDPTVDYFAAVVDRISEIRPWLRTRGVVPGWVLYELQDAPATVATTGAKRPSPVTPGQAQF